MVAQGGATKSDLIWLSEAQMRRIEPYFFPLSHGVPWVDDRRIISGIIYASGTVCAGATPLPSTGRQRRSTIVSSAGAGLVCSTRSSPASRRRTQARPVDDRRHAFKAYQTTASLKKRACSQRYWVHQRRPELKATCRLRWQGQTVRHAAEKAR